MNHGRIWPHASRLSGYLANLPAKHAKHANAQDLLVNNGYVRQAAAGTFNLLPLGLMVQNNLENLIRTRLAEIGAHELSLTSLTECALWKRSGRFHQNPDLFVVRDKYVLAPTNEEEITWLAKHEIQSYKQLPALLYQISRKYRNEKRPRTGLLRGREFVMKDMYSFDESPQAAQSTYSRVLQAYHAIFQDLKVPIKVAEAHSGSIGGTQSHEFHLLSPRGEDTLFHCDNCTYCANEELALSIPVPEHTPSSPTIKTFSGPDKELVQAVYPSSRTLNINLLARALGVDSNVLTELHYIANAENIRTLIDVRVDRKGGVPLVSAVQNELCPQCLHLGLQKSQAIEVGHTFLLGTRYSRTLDATFIDQKGQSTYFEMGCYGLGVSRLIAALADVGTDNQGLVWPAPVSAFQVVVVSKSAHVALELVNELRHAGITAVWDDRSPQFAVTLKNCFGLGFPVVVIAGRAYEEKGRLEVKCRRDMTTNFVPLEDFIDTVHRILD